MVWLCGGVVVWLCGSVMCVGVVLSVGVANITKLQRCPLFVHRFEILCNHLITNFTEFSRLNKKNTKNVCMTKNARCHYYSSLS